MKKELDIRSISFFLVKEVIWIFFFWINFQNYKKNKIKGGIRGLLTSILIERISIVFPQFLGKINMVGKIFFLFFFIFLYFIIIIIFFFYFIILFIYLFIYYLFIIFSLLVLALVLLSLVCCLVGNRKLFSFILFMFF